MLDWQLCQICYPLEIKLFITKLHEGLVPRQLHDLGKVILLQVQNEEVFVYDSKLKKKKLNISVKGKEVCRALSFAAFHNQDQNKGCENSLIYYQPYFRSYKKVS